MVGHWSVLLVFAYLDAHRRSHILLDSLSHRR